MMAMFTQNSLNAVYEQKHHYQTGEMRWGRLLALLALCVCLLPTSHTANVLSSLSDLDFHRIRAERAQSHAAETCPEVMVERGLEGAGYHRQLLTSVRRVGAGEYRDDRVLLVENITQDVYIDLDQLMSLDEFGGPEILASAHMDTERPAPASAHHVLLIYTHLINNTTDLRLPIHFRYQAPSDRRTYETVTIPAPLVFMPHPLGSASLPCHSYTRDTCLWELVALKEEEEEEGAGLRVEVPCGYQGLSSHLVVVVTVLVTLAGAVSVLCGMAGMEVESGKDK